jgi:hypothetical protein
MGFLDWRRAGLKISLKTGFFASLPAPSILSQKPGFLTRQEIKKRVKGKSVLN